MSEEQLRPICQSCGFADTATFTRTQLDVYDFQCPDCGSISFKFVRTPPPTNPEHDLTEPRVEELF